MAHKMATYAPLSLMQSAASVPASTIRSCAALSSRAALAAALYATEDFHAGVQAFR